ncbi:Piso0_004558 [Millerozyma farinosa CBS 7064]|uniref:Alpha-1,3/1,6-mannosyltransferase ALG2 n=1 Tax=Pichia sorbitophila (strain ATCC MYA-4447 / BCRC 22081 / CBS 7064 / NBRC 10061 / NRRL Y-12695) TaxID=559304 RepID=G8Y5T1_PICSO|nr:Piso0_004558 [Millerozyma farinosa CBS 7064]CCE84992.1 Piso0_004558 [Millerozyma farinosa CBS 7064]
MGEPHKFSKKKVAFIHPDLGIGGAERLVVDAAVGLQELGCVVKVYTSHCDRTHCFEEVSNNVLDVEVYGDFFPTNILKKFHILFAILRQFYLALALVFTGEIKKYDYFVVDQLSFCIPILRFFGRPESRILFYCHFPDQLLVQKGGILKKIYRLPFDMVEEWTTGISDRVVVNSNFTKGVFRSTFKSLASVSTGVIYPCVDLSSSIDDEEDKNVSGVVKNYFKDHRYFISVNRYERKKYVDLAVRAFAKFKDNLDTTKAPKPLLVIAGGYDLRVRENVDYLTDLEELAKSLGLKTSTFKGGLNASSDDQETPDVIFLLSIKTSLKKALIKNSELLLYTPSFEHFGIVPVESMLYKTPVLAANNGGPLESIVNYDSGNINTATGYTVDPNENKWADIITLHYTSDGEYKEKMGANGYNRVEQIFSRREMSQQFYENLKQSESSSMNKGILYKLLTQWKLYSLFTIVLIISRLMA